MDAIHVRRVAIRCRVNSSREVERERAQRVFRDDAAVALEDAVAQAGIAADEQICIRTLRLSARLWIGLTDDALRRAWAEALAAEIRRAIAGSDTASVVRYASAVASVLDALRCLARGDMARQWAWRQLGLATAIPPGGRRADAICNLLLCRPDTIVAALRALTDEPSFWRLLAALDDEQLERIADAALAASGIAVTIAALAETAAPGVTAIAPRASFVARRARVARQHAGQSSSVRRSTAIAALASLEVEPTLLRGDRTTIGTVIASIAAIINGAGDGSRPDAGEGGTGATRQDAPEPGGRTPDRWRLNAAAKHRTHVDEVPPQQRHARVDADESPSSGAGDHPDSASPANAGATRHDPAAVNGSEVDDHRATRPGTPHADAPHDHIAAGTAQRDERIRARSEWAGLLFLVNVLRDGELIDPLLDDPALADRTSQWVLHRLALVLVPAEPTDAAALAFAGLSPGQLPAEFADDIPSPDEQAALLRHGRACVAQACARLDAETDDELLYSICARAGEIVADPGWIDVRFPLTAIAVDIRRAGLDLDPGYIPWLGIVMKFSYV